MPEILLEIGSGLGKIRVGLAGSADPERPIYTLHLSCLGEIREDIIFCTGLNPDQLGKLMDAGLYRHSDDNIYCLYVCNEPVYEFSQGPNYSSLIMTQYFKIENGEILRLTESVGASKRAAQLDEINSPLHADNIKHGSALEFQVVVFYAGVYVHHQIAMKGITFLPVNPGISNSSIFEAIEGFLREQHTIQLPKGENLQKWFRYQPAYAIRFNHIIASSKESALNYVSQQARDITTIIASERGDKPFPVISLLLNRITGDWELIPTNFDTRGNITPPLHINTNVEQIEKIRPILNSNPYARLVLELFVQTLAERDRSYRFFRQWSLLEMIADKRIPTSTNPLVDDKGHIIYTSGTNALTTKNKAGKVYEYLRTMGMPQIIQGFNNGPTQIIAGANGGIDCGGGVIPLYNAVAAAYAIRNEVAHEGAFNASKSPNNAKEQLSVDFYLGHFDFLNCALNHVVWSEISAGN